MPDGERATAPGGSAFRGWIDRVERLGDRRVIEFGIPMRDGARTVRRRLPPGRTWRPTAYPPSWN